MTIPNFYFSNQAMCHSYCRKKKKKKAIKTTEYYRDVNSTGHIAKVHMKRVVFVDGSVIKRGPGNWDRCIAVTHIPVGLEDLLEVCGQTGAVVYHHAKFFHLQLKRDQIK